MGFNPDIVLIGDTVKFICPVVETPPNDRPDQRQVTNVGLTYEVKILYCPKPDQVYERILHAIVIALQVLTQK